MLEELSILHVCQLPFAIANYQILPVMHGCHDFAEVGPGHLKKISTARRLDKKAVINYPTLPDGQRPVARPMAHKFAHYAGTGSGPGIATNKVRGSSLSAKPRPSQSSCMYGDTIIDERSRICPCASVRHTPVG